MFIIFSSHRSQSNWQAHETKVDGKGKCKCCGLRLKPLPKLSAGEFSELREAFMEKSVMRNGNIFLHSTPEELNAYRNFLAHYTVKPFDIVIDGLNISHVTKQNASRLQKDNVVRELCLLFKLTHCHSGCLTLLFDEKDTKYSNLSAQL
jgi:hypothetical protein